MEKVRGEKEGRKKVCGGGCVGFFVRFRSICPALKVVLMCNM
jgi:hypothetical protein